MICPKDKEELVLIPSKMEGLKCPKCQGILIKTSGMTQAILESSLNKGMITNYNSGSNLTCQNCSGEMDKVIINQVEVDICKGCSILWFDIGELEKVQDYMKSDHKSEINIQPSYDDFGLMGYFLLGNNSLGLSDDRPFQWFVELKELLAKYFPKEANNN